jgi:adenosylcobinamide-phosphate synthase
VSRGIVTKRAGAVAAGLLADRALGEPPEDLHPVRAFGGLMARVEGVVYADASAAGALYTSVGAAVGATAGRLVRSTTVAVALAAAGRALRRTALMLRDTLDAGDLDEARALLPMLVGRDPSALDASGIAAAVVESVAENTVDAVVAPALWGLAGGARGALTYRAVNTMDAMVGQRSSRYARFGSCSARLDDGANFVPARVSAALVAVARFPVSGRVWRAVRDDAPAHPSPNAGIAEAAFAGALGIELGGPLRYGERFEERPHLGRGPRPVAADITRAVRLESDVEWLLVALLGATALRRWS